MNDWAAKVLAGVPRALVLGKNEDGYYLREADALAAIAKLAEGDGQIDRFDFFSPDGAAETEDGYWVRYEDHAAHIAALKSDRDQGAKDYTFLLDRHDMLHNEAAALRAKVARLEGALEFPSDWRERAHSFKGMLKLQAAWADGFNAARAALTDGGKDG